MARFCGKCGSTLDKINGLCPNCDAAQIAQHSAESKKQVNEQATDTSNASEKPLCKKDVKKKKKAGKKAAKKVKKKEKGSQMTISQKIRHFFLKIILAALLLTMVGAGIIGTLVYYEILDVPVVAAIMDEIGITSEPSFVGQTVNDCYIPNEENIVYENDNKSFGYVNNIVLIFVYKNVSDEKVAEIAKSIGGKIVGQISGINQYQIQIDSRERKQLESVCESLMKNDEVKYAMVDDVVMTENDDIQTPNDPWKDNFQGIFGVDWDERNPSGTNWWAEATNVLSAWQYDEYFSTINVGIVDDGFDTDHEDLKIQVLNNDVNSKENHGTHVAGVIGATINNNIGISGVLNHVNLYGVDCYATSKQEKKNINVCSLMLGIVNCLDNQCKVINMSSGTAFTTKEETKENSVSTARIAVKCLLLMLDEYDDDFIIVESSGNGNKANIALDASQYGGYFAAIDESIIQSILDEFEEIKKLEKNITMQDIIDSYMVIGAVDKKQRNGQYQLATFSNYGETVTVCAPGVDIFSTIVSGGIDGSYGYDSGTSMAAPIAAGITALVWSVDPTMTAGEVQDIIRTTATETVLSRNKNDNGTYRMIDASAAVEKAISKLNDKSQYNESTDNQYSDVADVFENTDIIGLWLNEGYDVDDSWQTSYKIEFYDDNSVMAHGWREKFCGTYKYSDGLIEVTFDETQFLDPAYGSWVDSDDTFSAKFTITDLGLLCELEGSPGGMQEGLWLSTNNIENLMEEVYPLCFFGFNYNYTSVDEIINNYICNGYDTPAYNYYFSKEEISILDNDPLNRFGEWYYTFQLPADNVNWIVKNIFNVEVKEIIDTDTLYYYDGFYYCMGGDAAYIGHSVGIKKIFVTEDEYTVMECDYYIYNELTEMNEKEGTVVIKIKQKDIDGSRFWTYYTITK